MTFETDSQARTIILRHVDRDRRRFRFHTDIRSAKVREIGMRPEAALLFHHPLERIQLRAPVTLGVLPEGPEVCRAWEATPPPVRRAYMSPEPPGTPSPEPTGGFPDAFADRLPTDRESAAGRPNFAVLEAALYRLEWLYLHADGHRRAAFTWPGGRLKAT